MNTRPNGRRAVPTMVLLMSAIIGAPCLSAPAQEGQPNGQPTAGKPDAASGLGQDPGGNNAGFNLFGGDSQDPNQPGVLDFGNLGELVPATGGFFGAADTTEEEDLILLSLKDVTVASLIPQIREWVGKPVFPGTSDLGDKKLTLVNDKRVTPQHAFELVAIAMFENGVAVIDKGAYLALLDRANLQSGDVPLIPANEDILSRTDVGMIAEKVYQIRYGKAEIISSELRKELLPPFAKMAVEPDSNQIIVLYNIGTLQRIQRLIDALDIRGVTNEIETFHLKYADAEVIAQLIVDLFTDQEDSRSNIGGGLFQPVRRGQQQSQRSGVATTADLKVAFNVQHNSVTIVAQQEVIDQIRREIEGNWDRPALRGNVLRVFPLENSDALKARELLMKIFAAPDSQGGVLGNVQTAGRRTNQPSRGASADDGPFIHPLAGQVSITVDEEKNALVVVVRSEDYFEEIAWIIEQIDTPTDPAAAIYIELRYANAETLATLLNVLYAERGTAGTIQLSAVGLTEGASTSLTADTGGGEGATPTQGEFRPWWASGRPPDDERKINDIIARIRIMPHARRNAVMVLAPPEKKAAIIRTIQDLDRPGRQVLIEAIVIEVRSEDNLELGIRWGSGTGVFESTSEDNQLRLLGNVTGEKQNLIDALFDTSMLGVNFDLNLALQALSETTDLSILSRPKIYTADNEEAIFFDGQDIPFITDSNFTDTGQLNQSFEYRAVGIRLGVRPHITGDGFVDMHINLELSSIVPGQTLFGGFILDRRETTTKVTVHSGQIIVLSGILREQESDIVRKVPFLGDLPLIGGLFRSTTKSKRNSELLAFVRPIIMENMQENDNLTPRDRDLLERSGYEMINPESFQDMGPTLQTMPPEESDALNPKGMDESWSRVSDLRADSVAMTSSRDDNTDRGDISRRTGTAGFWWQQQEPRR